jgi:hypothetical protein
MQNPGITQRQENPHKPGFKVHSSTKLVPIQTLGQCPQRCQACPTDTGSIFIPMNQVDRSMPVDPGIRTSIHPESKIIPVNWYSKPDLWIQAWGPTQWTQACQLTNPDMRAAYQRTPTERPPTDSREWRISEQTEGHSLLKSVCKVWKRCLLLQMHRHQHKSIKITINQRNMTSPKEQNKAPAVRI